MNLLGGHVHHSNIPYTEYSWLIDLHEKQT